MKFKYLLESQEQLDQKLRAKGLKRHTPVGKSIGGSIYLHKQYEDTLPQDQLSKAKKQLPKHFTYHIVKYTPKTQDFSFIISKDFDTKDEPSVNGGITVKGENTNQFGDNGWIYHHKWMFVKDDYKGFDVNKSKERSLKWTDLKDVDKSRIGQRTFWDKNVANRLSEEVRVGTKQACVVHGHPKKPNSKTDKPIGTPIKCYSFDKYGRKEAIKKAHAMHYAIQKSQIKEISDEYLTKPEIMKRVNFLKSTQRYASGEDRREIDKELEYWNKILTNPERMAK